MGKENKMKDKIKTELIDEFLTTNKLSVNGFCKIAKISKIDLQKIYEQNFDFDIEVLFKITKIMKINICNIFENPN